MKLTILLEEAGLELRLTPETSYERQAVKVLTEAAKLKPGLAGMITIPIQRDTSNESGPSPAEPEAESQQRAARR